MECLKPSSAPSSVIMSASVRARMQTPSCTSYQLGSLTTTRFTRTRHSDIVHPVSSSQLTETRDHVRSFGGYNMLGLDRVLLSLAQNAAVPSQQGDLALYPDDVREIARQALRYGQKLLDERVDRVFVHRAVEYAVAHRLRNSAGSELRHILAEVAHQRWIEHPYGVEFSSDSDDPASDDIAQVDERGVHAYYEIKDDCPSLGDVEELTQALLERRERARRSSNIPILDSYFEAPSLWLGPTPAITKTPPAALSVLHQHLFHLTFNNKTSDWKTRLLVLQALRRALLRESMLLRLLPEKADRDESGWGELLAQRFLEPLPGQHESMADRMAIFTEDVLSASGSAEERTSARYSLLDATRLRDQNFVALVLGGRDQQTRERIFSGFNTPLLPEVLVCTSVGAEGIDLHRHCRRIVHYDLAWNPAVLEQRTGRVDRIGSKTFREREAANGSEGPSLEVGVPFLAGTYDERMFEELRMRAQTFEVLTGGDVTSDGGGDKPDDVSGADDEQTSEGREESLHLKSLPSGMLRDLRAKLHVWIYTSEETDTDHLSLSGPREPRGFPGLNLVVPEKVTSPRSTAFVTAAVATAGTYDQPRGRLTSATKLEQ